MTASAQSPRPVAPIFLDATGRRWRRVRALGLLIGVVSSVLAAAVVVSLLVPPLLPQLPMRSSPFSRTPHLVTSKVQRERLAKRLQLWFALQKHRAPPAMHPSLLPLRAHTRAIGKSKPPGEPVVAGFYVNWDDNSLAALRAHADDLDWVVCEWAFVKRGGAGLRMSIDRKVPYTLSQVV